MPCPLALQVRLGKRLLVATMAQSVHCYTSSSGSSKQYSLPMPAPILCIQQMALQTARMTKCLLVGLASGEWGLHCTPSQPTASPTAQHDGS